MIPVMKPTDELTAAQYEVVNVLSCLHRKADIDALKTLLVGFVNDRLQAELDDLYDTGEISDETFANLSRQHLRTPYKARSC